MNTFTGIMFWRLGFYSVGLTSLIMTYYYPYWPIWVVLIQNLFLFLVFFFFGVRPYMRQLLDSEREQITQSKKERDAATEHVHKQQGTIESLKAELGHAKYTNKQLWPMLNQMYLKLSLGEQTPIVRQARFTIKQATFMIYEENSIEFQALMTIQETLHLSDEQDED